MKLVLDHVFILVGSGGEAVQALLEGGFREGPGNAHPGQGTANRRFFFANGMLEFLWVHDTGEAIAGPGRKLRFPERVSCPTASPYGVIVRPAGKGGGVMPFPGWTYQPDYFDPPWAFHVGANSDCLDQPLCIYAPFLESGENPRLVPERSGREITDVRISTPADPAVGVLGDLVETECLSFREGAEHLMELTLDNHAMGKVLDCRPAIPLVLRW
ncbi:MAG: VOC family protein [Xanthomonadales bacterium]|nr:VOC family protein [Xanthomonadales bacterium]